MKNKNKVDDDLELSTNLSTSYVSLKEEHPPPPQLKKQKSSGSRHRPSENLKKPKKEKKVVKFKWSTYRFLLGYPLKHWKLTILTNILIIIGSSLTVYLPWLVGQSLDSITNIDNIEEAKARHSDLVKKFLYVMTLLGIVSFMRNMTDMIWQNRLFNDMRYDVMAQFLSFDINFYQQHKTGQIMSRLMSDIQAAKNAVSSNLVTLLRNLVMTASNITILFYISWQLTVGVLIIMPFFGIATFVFSRISKRYAKENQQYIADMTSTVEEIFNGITTIKSFNGEKKSLKRYDGHLERIRKLVWKRAINGSIYQFNSVFLRQLGTLVVLWYGGNLVFESDSLTSGELASFILYALQLSNSSQQISGTYSSIITATGSFEGVLEMLQYVPVVREQESYRDIFKLKGDLELRKVCFEYPCTSVAVLRNVSLQIQQGEYLAFVGKRYRRNHYLPKRERQVHHRQAAGEVLRPHLGRHPPRRGQLPGPQPAQPQVANRTRVAGAHALRRHAREQHHLRRGSLHQRRPRLGQQGVGSVDLHQRQAALPPWAADQRGREGSHALRRAEAEDRHRQGLDQEAQDPHLRRSHQRPRRRERAPHPAADRPTHHQQPRHHHRRHRPQTQHHRQLRQNRRTPARPDRRNRHPPPAPPEQRHLQAPHRKADAGVQRRQPTRRCRRLSECLFVIHNNFKWLNACEKQFCKFTISWFVFFINLAFRYVYTYSFTAFLAQNKYLFGCQLNISHLVIFKNTHIIQPLIQIYSLLLQIGIALNYK